MDQKKPSGLLFLIFFLMEFNMQAQKQFPVYSQILTETIRLKPGMDLKVSLDDFIRKNQISAACILTCVGSLQQAVVRFANQPNADTLHGHYEIVSLTGTLAVTGSHLHISFSDSTGKTLGGHLKEGSIIYTTAEIVLGILPNEEYYRTKDTTYGYNELEIRKKVKRKNPR